MINLGDFYTSLTIVMILIFVGVFLSKIKILKEDFIKSISHLILSFTMPIALFLSFPNTFNAEDFSLFLWGLGAGFITLFILIVLAELIFSKRIVKKDNYEYKFAFIFNNTSFIGFPLVSTAFGPDGLVTYAGFMLPFIILIWTYGVWLFKENYTWRDTLNGFINPNVIGIGLGAILFILSINIPTIANDSLRLIGGLTTPLSLFVVGYMLSKIKIQTVLKKWQVAFVCILQLTIPAILTWLLLKLVNAPIVVINVIVLMYMLPTATSLGLFHKKYKSNKDATEAGELVTISTLMAAITVPILIYLLLS